jgi:hypothetical protein
MKGRLLIDDIDEKEKEQYGLPEKELEEIVFNRLGDLSINDLKRVILIIEEEIYQNE